MKVINKKSLIKSLAVSSVLLFSLMSGANAATTTGDARVLIVSPLTLAQNQSLNFGIVAPDSASSSTVDQDGTVVGNASYISGAQKAVFDVTGYLNSAYTVAIDSSVVLASSEDKMEADLAVVGGTSRNLSDGKGSFDVNGTLTIAASQAAGTYTGTYNVTVNYN
jgi:fructose-specific component phosphotransferase system IIB-like protein